MKIFFKIAIRILPIFAIFVLAYILYLNFYGDRSDNSWFGGRNSTADMAAESKKANLFIDNYYAELSSSTDFSVKNPSWPDCSDLALEKKYEFAKKTLKFIRDSIKNEGIDSSASFRIRKLQAELNSIIESYRFKMYEYPINHIDGLHIGIYNFLHEQQHINNVNEAELYLKKLKTLPSYIHQILILLKSNDKNPTLPPRYLFKHIYEQLNQLSNPIVLGPQKNIILADFETKINGISLEKNQNKALLDSCSSILKTEIIPALNKIEQYFISVESKSLNSAGVWKFKDGDEYYSFLLKNHGGTDLTPNTIFDLGNEEISRLHKEIIEILNSQGINTKLRDYFQSLRYSNSFYYPKTAYADKELANNLRNDLDFLEKNCPKFFSLCPSDIFEKKIAEKNKIFEVQKISLSKKNIEINPSGYSFPVLMTDAYTCFLLFPGKAYVQNFSTNNANCENYSSFYKGWALYATYIAKELGFFRDRQSNLGRLYLELWHSCHLVADVGLHSKRWTREQATQFYRNNTPFNDADINYIVDYIAVQPAKAVSAKIGMLTILELLDKTKKALNDSFDLKEFHDTILKNGCIPLFFLEDIVDEYIKKKSAK
jgi:uncharacterized protein (DUF885 family)